MQSYTIEQLRKLQTHYLKGYDENGNPKHVNTTQYMDANAHTNKFLNWLIMKERIGQIENLLATDISEPIAGQDEKEAKVTFSSALVETDDAFEKQKALFLRIIEDDEVRMAICNIIALGRPLPSARLSSNYDHIEYDPRDLAEFERRKAVGIRFKPVKSETYTFNPDFGGNYTS